MAIAMMDIGCSLCYAEGKSKRNITFGAFSEEKVGNKQRITVGDRRLQGADQDQEVPSTSVYTLFIGNSIFHLSLDLLTKFW